MSVTQVIAKNTLHQFVGKFITMAITILTTALVTRIYGVEGYGAFNLIITFPAIFYIIADFGFNAIGTRDLTKDESKIGEYLGTIFLLRVLISFILILIATVIILFLPYTNFIRLGIFLSLFTILTTTLFSTANIGFQVKLRYDLSRTALVAGSLVILILVSVFSFFRTNLILVSFSYVIAGVVNTVLAFYFLKGLGIIPQFKFNKELAKKLTLTSIPLGLMFIFSQINFKTDAIFLSFLKLPATYGLNNIETVGVYGLAYKVFEVSLIVPTFFMNAVYPIMVKRYSEDKKLFMNTFKKSMLSLFAAGVCFAVFGFLFSDLIIFILGGQGFSYSAMVLKILLGGIFIFYLTQPVAWFIVTLNGEKYLPYIYLVAAILNVSLNLIFISKYSFFASAHITWISELFILSLLSLTALKLYKKSQ